MKKNLNLLSIVFLAFTMNAYAQESNNPIDTLAAYVQKMNTTVTNQSKLKISGYIQFQFQKADTLGINSFAGGNFDAKTDNRFNVRRGRVKFAYAGTLSNYVLQFDVTEKGLGIKDAYMNFTDSWLQAFTVTGGVFNKPFGYEIAYSSSQRESPERARFTQTLFPGERDLGAMLTFQMPKASPWNFFKIDAGLFAGNGTNPEFDKKKDFIGRVGIVKLTPNEKIKYSFGLSYYNGGVYQGSVNTYKIWEDNGVKTFFKTPIGTDTIGSFQKREYKGFDAQITIETVIGLTSLRGEYVMGIQPGQSKTSTSPTTDFTKVTAPATAPDTYIRNFKGGYIYFVQSISHTPITLVVKYDFYDPNTKINGNNIGLTTTGAKVSTAADLKYTTLGLGAILAVSNNVKITAYYDMVKNESSSNLTGFRKDLKDNVFTLRIQYKF
ncbi:MAG: hypothetical protein EHM93_09250 [Bacteroidales bacterium]|nr:MAG: hypothetical protein EHM93_09250 [Bacteroidales bacterium]